MFIQTLFDLVIPILRLCLIFLLHDIFSCQGHNFLKPDHKHIWLVISIKREEPLRNISLFHGYHTPKVPSAHVDFEKVKTCEQRFLLLKFLVYKKLHLAIGFKVLLV